MRGPFRITHALLALLLILISASVHAATISGTVYDGLTLEVQPDAVITINTTPAQTKLTKDGTYSFTLPPGEYEIVATYSESGIPLLDANRSVNVVGDGTFVIDLILLPTLGNFPDDVLPDDEPLTIWEQLGQGPLVWLGIIGILLVGAGYAVLHVRQNRGMQKTLPEVKDTHAAETLATQAEKHTAFDPENMDKYALEVMQILQRSGNRMTQKDIRTQVSIGEAKVSLIISELENYGLVKKIKKGRGNILILTEKGRTFSSSRA